MNDAYIVKIEQPNQSIIPTITKEQIEQFKKDLLKYEKNYTEERSERNMKYSKLDIYDILRELDNLSPVKVILNDKVIYNDYDSKTEIEPGICGELRPPRHVIPSRLNFKKYIIEDIKIEIVDCHHSILTLNGYELV